MNAADLVAYVRRVHGRTHEAAAAIPADRLDWRPRPGEFTFAGLVGHIAAARRMNLGILRGRGIHYPGHESPAGTHAAALLGDLQASSDEVLAALATIDLEQPVESLTAPALPGWNRLLGGLVEHEIHHRAQLCEFLSAAGVEPPALYGLHVEDLPR